MRSIANRVILAAVAAALLTACGAEAPAPAPAPAPKPKPVPKITQRAFAVPILEGKLDTWKSFIGDAGEARAEEWDAARAAAGLTREVVWHQATPAGDFAVVYQEGPDLAKVFPAFAASETQIDVDFMAMLQDVHGLDPSSPPPTNPLAVSYQGDGSRGTPYGFMVPVTEGQSAVAEALVAAVTGERKAEFEASRERMGLLREHVWRQGDAYVIVGESADPAETAEKFRTSEDPFDVWMREQVSTFAGVDFSQPSPRNTVMLDWTAPAETDDDAEGEAAEDEAPAAEE